MRGSSRGLDSLRPRAPHPHSRGRLSALAGRRKRRNSGLASAAAAFARQRRRQRRRTHTGGTDSRAVDKTHTETECQGARCSSSPAGAWGQSHAHEAIAGALGRRTQRGTTKRDELKKSHRWPLFTSLSASFHCLGGESFHKPANGKKVRANLNARGQGP